MHKCSAHEQNSEFMERSLSISNIIWYSKELNTLDEDLILNINKISANIDGVSAKLSIELRITPW
jgi:hypothetical protein